MITENYFEKLQQIYEKYKGTINMDVIDTIIKEVLNEVKKMEGESKQTYNFRIYNCIYERLDDYG